MHCSHFLNYFIIINSIYFSTVTNWPCNVFSNIFIYNTTEYFKINWIYHIYIGYILIYQHLLLFLLEILLHNETKYFYFLYNCLDNNSFNIMISLLSEFWGEHTFAMYLSRAEGHPQSWLGVTTARILNLEYLYRQVSRFRQYRPLFFKFIHIYCLLTKSKESNAHYQLWRHVKPR